MTASVSIVIKPQEDRGRYWSKIVRADQTDALPLPKDVSGANDVPGQYLRNGDEELFLGDFWFEGEEMHHHKSRGWSYNLHFIDPKTGELRVVQALSQRKAAAKKNGLPAEYLAGSGEVAGLVRLAHAVRLGISIDIESNNQ